MLINLENNMNYIDFSGPVLPLKETTATSKEMPNLLVELKAKTMPCTKRRKVKLSTDETNKRRSGRGNCHRRKECEHDKECNIETLLWR